MAHAAPAVGAVSSVAPFQERRRTADRVFRGALLFNLALTIFWLVTVLTQRSTLFFPHYNVDRAAILRVAQGILWFYVIWGFIWFGIKALLLKYMVGFS